MPTFLALQCYKCNMMQVKHDKKSSNKWTCSLCNEKQSVRKVFATSMAAKDIRNFVQEYNFSRNSVQDRALAELALNVEEGGNAGFVHNDALFGDALCDKNSQARDGILLNGYSHPPQVNAESKWNEYLPQDDGNYAEIAEDNIDDARFVTVIPRTYARKAKGRVRAAPKTHNEPHPLQQKQREKNDKFSKGPFECIRACLDATHRENALPISGSQKVPLSSHELPNPASIQNGQRLSAYKAPQRIVPHVQMQASAAGELFRARRLIPQSCEKVTSVASRRSIALTETKKPVSRYTTCLDGVGQKAFATVKQETHVSKWAKFMDSAEVTYAMPALKEGNLVDEPKEGSSIWALRAVSNMQHFNGLVKTELDELMNAPCMAGEEGGGDLLNY